MYGKFLVEGDKPVKELLASAFQVYSVFSVSGWSAPETLKNADHVIVSEDELRRISTLENPKDVIAVAGIPSPNTPDLAVSDVSGWVLCLDRLNDPGNAGTIIRIADWFGISSVLFSDNSVDIYNPKVVSAAKGSLFRVKCTYVQLPEVFQQHPEMPVYGTFMTGDNLYTTRLAENAFILIGNEANGIGEDLLPYITRPISIPAFGRAESLNAGVATGIIVSELVRRKNY